MIIDLDKELFSDYLISTKEIDSPTDMLTPSGNSNIDRNVEQDILAKYDTSLRKEMRGKFEADRNLQYAFHLSYICSNKNLLWLLKTSLYFFETKE